MYVALLHVFDVTQSIFTPFKFGSCLIDVKSFINLHYTVEPLLYDHPQNHIGVVV